MTSKSKEGGRKSLSPWMACDKCQSTVTLKDVAEHDTNCPPNLQNWNHDFILNGTLYSTLETYKSQGMCADILSIVFYTPSHV